MKFHYKSIKIKFIGKISRFLSSKFPKCITHIFIDRTSIKDLIESFNIPHTEVDVILINGKSVNFDYIIQDKDKIEVFADYKGLSSKNLIRLKTRFRGKPKFVCDVHLGKLAKEMRKLGLDVFYKNNLLDEDIVKISNEEKRIILTRDSGLLKRKSVRYGMYLFNDSTKKQILEIALRFNIHKYIKPFTVCLECGKKLSRISSKKAIEKLKGLEFREKMSFYRCLECDRIYWQGTHYKSMSKSLNSLIHSLKQIRISQ